MSPIPRTVYFFLFVVLANNCFAQAPTVSYSGPQTYTAYAPTTPLSPASTGVAAPAYASADTLHAAGMTNPYAMAADGAGNVYVADNVQNKVFKFPAGGGPAVLYWSYGVNNPQAIAADFAGNVYVAMVTTDGTADNVYKILPGGGSEVTIGTGFTFPDELALDPAGNVYVLDGYDATAVYKIPVAGGTKKKYNITLTPGPGGGMTFDNSGNFYVTYSGGITEEPANGTPGNSIGGLTNGQGIVADAAGNIFGINGSGQAKEVPAGGAAGVSLFFGSLLGRNIAVDGAGNVYAVSKSNSAPVLLKIQPVGGYYIKPFLPAGLAFNNNTGVISGTPTVASPATNYTVTAYNSAGSNQATVNIQVNPGLSNVVDLALIEQHVGIMAPDFSSSVTNYTIPVTYEITSDGVTPYTADVNATMDVNGAPLKSGTPVSIPLAVGPNPISIVVTAQNGTSKTYTVNITRAPEDADLVNIKPSTGGLSPAFSSSVTSYHLPLPNADTSIAFTASLADGASSLTVNGVATYSGQVSKSIPLAVGPNLVHFVVTTSDETLTKTYTITVTRAGPLSSNAYLGNLTPSLGGLSPGFSALVTGYTLSLGNVYTSITFTPHVSDATATVKINGTTVASGTASPAIPLAVGANVINVVVTAQDGSTTKTYTVTVTRAGTLSADANLANLTPGLGGLSPAFSSAITSYAISLNNIYASITFTPHVADATATVKINGTTVASGAVSPAMPLAVGPNVVNVVVTAQDGTTSKTYSITVTRAAALSANASLANLTPGLGSLTPAFSSATNSYTILLTAIYSEITFTPHVAEPAATVKVNGATVASGTASPDIALTPGPNVVNVVVTAQNGTTSQTYTVTILNGSDASLVNLTPSQGGLSPAFSSVVTSYSINLGALAASISFTPHVQDADATVAVNGIGVTSGTPSPFFTLETGSNLINIVVTARDEITTKTYAVTVNKGMTGDNSVYQPVSVEKPINNPTIVGDGITVHPGVSPNGDGINDFLHIDNISQYPDNKLSIMNRNGQLIYEAKGYDNGSKTFDGHSNKNGQMQLPGTYFYQLDYTVNGITKHKTGFLVLMY